MTGSVVREPVMPVEVFAILHILRLCAPDGCEPPPGTDLPLTYPRGVRA